MSGIIYDTEIDQQDIWEAAFHLARAEGALAGEARLAADAVVAEWLIQGPEPYGDYGAYPEGER